MLLPGGCKAVICIEWGIQMRSGMQTNVTRRLRVRTERQRVAWSWDNLKEKMHPKCSVSFSIAALPFIEMEENHSLLQDGLLPPRHLNSRVSTLLFSSQGFLSFLRTKSTKSCYYLQSGSVQRRPVLVQKTSDKDTENKKHIGSENSPKELIVWVIKIPFQR